MTRRFVKILMLTWMILITFQCLEVEKANAWISHDLVFNHNKQYVFTIISAESDPKRQAQFDRQDKEHQEYYDKALKFLLGQYDQSGLFDPNSPVVKEFTSGSQRLNKPGSVLIIVSEVADPDKIISMMRIDRPTKSEPLSSMEYRLLGKGLNEPLPRPEPSWQMTLKRGGPGYDIDLWYIEGKAPRADFFEIKNMARSIETEKDLVPLMYFYAEQNEITSKGVEFLHDATSTHISVPYGYLAETENEHVFEYYTKTLGFEEVKRFPDPQIQGKVTHILKITRERFIEKALVEMESRLDKAHTDPYQIIYHFGGGTDMPISLQKESMYRKINQKLGLNIPLLNLYVGFSCNSIFSEQ